MARADKASLTQSDTDCMRTEKQKMLAGELYHAGDPEIQADQAAAKVWMVRYKASLAASAAERRALLRELLSGIGDGAVIRPPVPLRFRIQHPDRVECVPQLQLRHS